MSATDDIISRILEERGVSGADERSRFLAPDMRDLVPPPFWPQVPQAAECIAEALDAGRLPAVWGDYDCDGVTATAVMLDMLEHYGFKPLHHIPSRTVEGYGLNCDGIRALHGEGAGLLITVDCGISSFKEVELAKELGMTVVVTDHHLPGKDGLPAADAVCDMHAAEGRVPDRNLCGAGVAFFVAGELNRLLSAKFPSIPRFDMGSLLDIVALGTIADSVPLLGQNRLLAAGGVRRMQSSPRPGVAALLEASGCAGRQSVPLTGEDVAFRLVPRINAAGRIASAEEALLLLRCSDAEEAKDLAAHLTTLNDQRREIERRTTEAALAMAERKISEAKERGSCLHGLVLYDPDWHEGVVGITASKIAEAFGMPVMLFCGTGETVKGSGRSVPGTDLYAVLEGCKSDLLGFGGHAMAAGARMDKSRLPAFSTLFSIWCGELMNKLPKPASAKSIPLDFDEAFNHDFIRALMRLEPCGEGNPRPVFTTCGATCIDVRAFRTQPKDNPSSGMVVLRDLSGGQMRIKVWNDLQKWKIGEFIRSIDYTLGLNEWTGGVSIECSLVKAPVRAEAADRPEAAPAAGA